MQFLAPEVDEQFPVELKMYAFKKLVRSILHGRKLWNMICLYLC